jgi:hypothetical protein
MEPLSALSAVGAVSSCLQVVDFGAKVAFQTYRLLNAPYDTLRENIEVEGLIRGYDSIAQDLTDPQKQRRPLTAEETDLSELAEQCKAESKALLDLLQDLKVRETNRGIKRAWSSGRKALKLFVSGKRLKLKDRGLMRSTGS